MIMKKTGLIIGSIEIILGLISLFVTSVINQVIPKVAKMCFMFNTGMFSEADYIPNFGFANTIAVCLFLIGVFTVIYFVFIKKDQ
jgi:hypothetical protein